MSAVEVDEADDATSFVAEAVVVVSGSSTPSWCHLAFGDFERLNRLRSPDMGTSLIHDSDLSPSLSTTFSLLLPPSKIYSFI